jgi:hypothetical protein
MQRLGPTSASQEVPEGHELALCLSCCKQTLHEIFAKEFLRKDRLRCLLCNRQSVKCDKFEDCRGLCKTWLLWDEIFCEMCFWKYGFEMPCSEIPLGDYFDSCGRERKTKKVQTQKIKVAPSSPEASVKRGTSPAKSFKEFSDACCTAKPSIPVRISSANALFADDQSLDGSKPHRPLSLQSRFSRPPSLRQVSAFTHAIDEPEIIAGPSQPTHDEEEEEEEEDPRSAAVRDAVLCWPGPERELVDSYRSLCAHRAFAARWLAACAGDDVAAVRGILAHLQWRQAYGVDSICDEEVPPTSHIIKSRDSFVSLPQYSSHRRVHVRQGGSARPARQHLPEASSLNPRTPMECTRFQNQHPKDQE